MHARAAPGRPRIRQTGLQTPQAGPRVGVPSTITRSEAHVVDQQGCDAFEDVLTRRDPDFMDLKRPSLV